jgi:hypothetical protein
VSPSKPAIHSGKGVLWATAKSSTTWSQVLEGEAGTMHIRYYRYVHACASMSTSSGVRTTAGREAGAEHLRPAGNLDAAAERSWKTAAEGLGPTGGLEAAAEYVMGSAAEEVTTLQEGSESSAAAGLGAGFGAGASSDAAGATSDGAGATSEATEIAAALDATSEASLSALERDASFSASASASSFSMKIVPSTSTAFTGPAGPRYTRRLALGWAYAAA